MGRGKRRQVSIGMGGKRLPEFKEVNAIFESLRALKVQTVTMDYYGGNEEYGVEPIVFDPAAPIEVVERLEEDLEKALVTVLGIGAPNWDEDEGSSGKATFDIGAGVIAVDHAWYEEGSTGSNETYSLTDLEELGKGAVKGNWLGQALAQMRPFFTELESRGLTSVTARYNGGGDSGQVEEVEGEAADGKEDGVEELLSGLAVDDLAMTIVSLDHSGWENNRGGTGSVTFDVKGQEVVLSHADYEIEEREDLFALEGFMPFEIVKLKRGPRDRVSSLAAESNHS